MGASSPEVDSEVAITLLAQPFTLGNQVLTICSLEGGHDSRSVELYVIKRPVLRIRKTNTTLTSQKYTISYTFFSKVSLRLLNYWLFLLGLLVIVNSGLLMLENVNRDRR